jgi:hypothetical protein
VLKKLFDATERMGKNDSSGVMFGPRWRNVHGVGNAQIVAVADNGLDLIGCNNFCAVLLRFARRILRCRDDIVMTWTDSFKRRATSWKSSHPAAISMRSCWTRCRNGLAI